MPPARRAAPAATVGRPLEVFDVSVLGAADHVWLSVSCAQGSVFGISRPLPVWPAGIDDPLSWLSTAVRHARLEAGGQAQEIGRILTDLVFGVPDVAGLLLQARGAVAAAGGQLLVRVLAAPHDVASWPWELMIDPQRADQPAVLDSQQRATSSGFLTQARDVHVVRSARSRTYATRHAPIEPPMNLLMVMSSPLGSGGAEDTTPFDLYEEKRSLLAELQPLIDRGLLYVEIEDRPTLERLRSRIGRQRRGFHLFHYLGHAQPAGIRLEQPDGRGRLVASQHFARLLQQMPDLRLAVFAGCETARPPNETVQPGAWPGPLSIADLCVRDACPMVVGMQAVLPFRTERLFTRFFYQALTGGQAVAEALRLARLAVADDEYTGGTLVNWAVPSLLVGGGLPGPVTDPTALAEAPRPIRRLGIRMGVQQSDLRFISRLSELRVCVDVLSGQGSTRLVQVVGGAGTGKTALLDRAVEELDPEIRYLFVSARRLLMSEKPVSQLGGKVADLLKASNLRRPSAAELDSSDGWDRMLDASDDLRLAIVIDDADSLNESTPAADELTKALVALVGRRSRTRLAVACSQPIVALTARLNSNQASVVRLGALAWSDVWAWIRRNLPALTRLDENMLAQFYADLPHLEQWEVLANHLVARPNLLPSDLPTVVAQIARNSTAPTAVLPRPTVGSGEPIFGEPEPAPGADEPTRRPLRVAVAGPFTEGRAQQFGRGVTRFAAAHAVGGRVTEMTGDSAGSLAELIPLDTPFSDGQADIAALTAWLDAARQEAADIVVLDVGSERPQPAVDEGIHQLVTSGCLVIAAGGVSGRPCWPAWNPTVLAIGALDESGSVAAYSPYFPDRSKPELYAPAQLVDTSIKDLVADPSMQGTALAALNAAAVAITVWSTDRDLTAAELRQVLVSTAMPIEPDATSPRRIDPSAALGHLRQSRVLDILQWQSMELGQLVAESGMRAEVVIPIVDQLVETGRIQRQRTGDTETLVDPTSLTLQYRQLRAEPPGNRRTVRMQRIVDQVKELADQGRFTPAKVDGLWRGGDDAQRLVALAVTQAVPAMGSIDMLRGGITASRSAFEQYQALVAARVAMPQLSDQDRDKVAAALRTVQGSSHLEKDSSRNNLVNSLLAELDG